MRMQEFIPKEYRDIFLKYKGYSSFFHFLFKFIWFEEGTKPEKQCATFLVFQLFTMFGTLKTASLCIAE